MPRTVNRRQFLRGTPLAAAGLSMNALFPSWARSATTGLATPLPMVSGTDIALTIGHAAFEVDGRMSHAVTVNGTVPGPLIRLKQGQNVRLAVTNTLSEDSSIHWHGLLLPFQMDGVPGLSFQAFGQARPSSTISPYVRPAPIGITAIRACRSRSVTWGRS